MIEQPDPGSPGFRAFAINLAREPARRAGIEEQLRSCRIPHEIFPAIDALTLDDARLASSYDAVSARRRYREMSRGEVACALSHIAVYRRILDAGLRHALVLEDDAQLGASLPMAIGRLCEQIPAERPVVVLLTHVDKYSGWGRESLGGAGSLVRRYRHWWRAHGYFVTREAAARMAEMLMPVSSAADHWAQFDESGIVELRALVPYCIGLSGLAAESSIEPERSVRHAEDHERRGPANLLRHYVYQRFLYQITVRPFLRVRRQAQTW
jgi:glycosyl transferase, family 25